MQPPQQRGIKRWTQIRAPAPAYTREPPAVGIDGLDDGIAFHHDDLVPYGQTVELASDALQQGRAHRRAGVDDYHNGRPGGVLEMAWDNAHQGGEATGGTREDGTPRRGRADIPP